MFEEQPQLEESFTIHLGELQDGVVNSRLFACGVNQKHLCVVSDQRSAAEDDAQPAAGPSRSAGLLQTPAARQQRSKAAAPADGAVAVLVLPLRAGAAGGQQGELLQRHQERSGHVTGEPGQL